MIGFALLTGARPPVVRATVMVVCVLAARALGRPASTLEAIAVAGAALLAHDPENLRQPGFQLSFAAVLAFAWALRPSSGRPRIAAAGEADQSPGLLRRFLRCAARFLLGGLRTSLAATAATTLSTSGEFCRNGITRCQHHGPWAPPWISTKSDIGYPH